ncbi:unnamed protein product, partial [marine sediment metagenome]
HLKRSKKRNKLIENNSKKIESSTGEEIDGMEKIKTDFKKINRINMPERGSKN